MANETTIDNFTNASNSATSTGTRGLDAFLNMGEFAPAPISRELPTLPQEETTAPTRAPLSSYDEAFQRAESQYGLPNGLLSTMAYQESRFNPNAVNQESGATGILQFIPRTAKEYGINPRDPNASINAAGKKMAGLVKYYNGDITKAVAAYNYGEGNLNKVIRKVGDNWMSAIPEETQGYLSNILGGRLSQAQAPQTAQADTYDIPLLSGGVLKVPSSISREDALAEARANGIDAIGLRDLPLASGSKLRIPDNITDEDALAEAKELHPDLDFTTQAEAEHQEKMGFMPSAKSAAISVGSTLLRGESEMAQGAGQAMGFPSLEQLGTSGIEKSKEWEKKAGEIAEAPTEADAWYKQVPYYAGQVAGGIGPYAAGLALAPEAVAPSLLAGTMGSQALGSMAQRTDEQGKDFEVMPHLPAAAAETAANYLGVGVLGPLKGKIQSRFMEELLTPNVQKYIADVVETKGVEAGKAAVGSKVADIAKEFGLNTAGMAFGDVGSAVIERAATGQDLASPEAMDEYWENLKTDLVGGGLLAGPMGLSRHAGKQGALEQAQAEAEAPPPIAPEVSQPEVNEQGYTPEQQAAIDAANAQPQPTGEAITPVSEPQAPEQPTTEQSPPTGEAVTPIPEQPTTEQVSVAPTPPIVEEQNVTQTDTGEIEEPTIRQPEQPKAPEVPHWVDTLGLTPSSAKYKQLKQLDINDTDHHSAIKRILDSVASTNMKKDSAAIEDLYKQLDVISPEETSKKKLDFGEALGYGWKPQVDREGRITAKLKETENEELRKAVHSSDINSTISVLSESKNPIIRHLAETTKNLTDLNIKVGGILGKAKRGATRAGEYSPSAHTIRLNPKYAGNETTVGHELLHANVYHAIENPTQKQKPSVEGLKKLHETVKTHPTLHKEYGVTNVHEFVSEGLTNPEFQYKLKKIKYENTTMWGKFTQSIANMLGVKRDNAFIELLTHTENLLPSEPVRRREGEKGAKPIYNEQEQINANEVPEATTPNVSRGAQPEIRQEGKGAPIGSERVRKGGPESGQAKEEKIGKVSDRYPNATAEQKARLDMTSKEAAERIDRLTEGARQIERGEITHNDYQKLVDENKPVTEYNYVPKPEKDKDMWRALQGKDKKDKLNAPIEEGKKVNVRLDIPAYTDSNVWVPTIHEGGKTIAHRSTSIINNVTMQLKEKSALLIATRKMVFSKRAGKDLPTPKSPIATMEGAWENHTPEQAYAEAKKAMEEYNKGEGDWTQVGMDPERHSYFYDRKTQQPITSADRVIQVGPLVLAKNAKRGEKAKEDYLYSEVAPDEPFYSQLERQIRASKQVSMPGNQWAAWLKGNAAKLGIKADEIYHSAIEDYLNLRGKDRVSKQEILDHLNDYGTKIEESLLGKESDTRWASKGMSFEKILMVNGKTVGQIKSTSHGYTFTKEGENVGEILPKAPKGSIYYVVEDNLGYAKHVIEERYGVSKDIAKKVSPKYSSYTVPGGTNYREMLITLKNKPFGGEDYTSSHWEMPNVLAHARFSDRVDVNGKKTLFVEELQSDWGQQGRDKGFSTRRQAEIRAELVKIDVKNTELLAKLKKATTDTERFSILEERADLLNKAHALDKELGSKGTLPNAPFVTDTKAWTALAIKRVVRHAVENGYDNIAFANGAQNAGHYNLAKQEGMKSFYDKIVPSVANDILKKLGVGKIEKINLKTQDGFSPQLGFEITPKLTESVMGGMPLYSEVLSDEPELSRLRSADILVDRSPKAEELKKQRTKDIEKAQMAANSQTTLGRTLNKIRAKFIAHDSMLDYATREDKTIAPNGEFHERILRNQAKERRNFISSAIEHGYVTRSSTGLLTINRSDKLNLVKILERSHDLPKGYKAEDVERILTVLANEGHQLRYQDIERRAIQRRADATKLMNFAKTFAKGSIERKTSIAAAKEIRKLAESDQHRVDKIKAEGGVAQHITPKMISDAHKVMNSVPEIKAIVDDVHKVMRSLVDLLESTGNIDATVAREWRDPKYQYAPLYMSTEELESIGESNISISSAVKGIGKVKAKGVSEHKINMFENLQKHYAFAVDAAMENNYKTASLKWLAAHGSARELASNKGSQFQQVVNVIRKGKSVLYAIDDPVLFDAFKDIARLDLPSFITAPSMVVRKGALINPMFWYRQLVRDPVMANFTAQTGLVTPIGAARSFLSILTNHNAEYKELVNKGVLQSQSNLADQKIEFIKGKKQRGAVKKGWSWLQHIHEAADAATRVEVYKAALEEAKKQKGLTKEQQNDFAVSRARDFMSFANQGSDASVRMINQSVPFFNSFLNGMDVILRNATGMNMSKADAARARKLFRTRAMYMTLASMAYAYTLSSNSEEYREAKASDWMSNWLIPGLGDGRMGKVASPFEIGVVFKLIPEAMVRQIMGLDTGERTKELLFNSILNGLTPPLPIPAFIKPILEAATGKAMFDKNPAEWFDIESRGSKDLVRTERGRGKSYLSDAFSDITGMSPAVSKQLLSGYGTEVFSVADMLANGLSKGFGEQVDKDWTETVPYAKAFVTNPNSLADQNEVYDQAEKFKQFANTMTHMLKVGDPRAALYSTSENMPFLYGAKAETKIIAAMTKLTQAMAYTINDPSLTTAQKKKQYDELLDVKRNILSIGADISKEANKKAP